MGTNDTFSHGNMSHLTEAEILGFTVNVTLLVIHGLQGCIAIITNLITIIAVAKYTFLNEEATSRFVVSLATADLLAGLTAFIEIALEGNLELNIMGYPLQDQIVHHHFFSPSKSLQ